MVQEALRSANRKGVASSGVTHVRYAHTPISLYKFKFIEAQIFNFNKKKEIFLRSFATTPHVRLYKFKCLCYILK